jgi:uncharacterized protein
MLTPEDRTAIESLFDRLEEVERNGPPRDQEAEALIGAKVVRQPGAPYYLAQTVLVQEHALKMAEERIEELERRASQRRQSGGFLGGLFGDNGSDYEERRPVNNRPVQPRGPWQQQDDGYNRGGGGFLAGAAQTALGVTSGILLGSAIASMFGAGSANAAEGGQDQGSDQNSDQGGDQGGEDAGPDGGGDFGGGDFGDGGGFDMGGDF